MNANDQTDRSDVKNTGEIIELLHIISTLKNRVVVTLGVQFIPYDV